MFVHTIWFLIYYCKAYKLVYLYEDDYGDREDNANTDSDSHENNMTNIPH